MKKVGILTFSRANNYGALLQAYALKMALKNLGADAEMINYKAPSMEVWHNPNPFVNRGFKNFLKKILFFPAKLYVRRLFSPFMDKYLDGKSTYSRAELPNLEKNYDCFITGSDQVFNKNLTAGDDTYFLDFVKDGVKKYSYAASFGSSDFSKADRLRFKELLKNFEKISLREESGADFVKNLLPGKETALNLDPTLLLSKSEWSQIAKEPDNGDYILFYSASNNEKIIKFLSKMSENTKLPIYYCDGSFLRKPLKSKHLLCTPQEWLGYFLKAKYVVTNSFHGLAFSINFNKDFFVDLLPPPSKVNARLENLLKLTGLKGRLIDNIGDNYEEEISWGEVNSVMEKEREKSNNYLKEIITK